MLRATVFTNGTLQMQLAGLVGEGYVLQATTNFVNWISIQTNAPPPDRSQTLPTNLIDFSDPLATDHPARFYRAVQLR